MHFAEAEVSELLSKHYEQIESIWDEDPFNEVKAFAVTIKEFMTAHKIATVKEGVRQFIVFKEHQRQKLCAVGLGSEASLIPSPHLALVSSTP